MEANFLEKRNRTSDRRQREAERDIMGYIKEPTYKGTDRRKSIDRRAVHKKKQQGRVRKEKVKFMVRSAISTGTIFLSIVAVSVLLLFPEYAQLDKFIKKAKNLKNAAVKSIPENFSISAALNKKIKEFEEGSKAAKNIYKTISIKNGARSVVDLSQMINRINNMQNSIEGSAIVKNSISNLRAVIYETANDPERLNKVINAAKKYDKTLSKILGNVSGKDVAAAAMLLAMNEFRSNVYNGRPYYKDIALLKKITGNNPEMNAAIDRLEPYAERGAISKEALESQFKGLAKDIVLAKVRGEDIELRNRAVTRFNNFLAMKKIAEINAEDEAAIVARAQLMLDAGDVAAAVEELQRLDGISAKAAQPWMANAKAKVIAEESSDLLMQSIVAAMSGSAKTNVDSLIGSIKNNLSGHGDALYVSPALRSR